MTTNQSHSGIGDNVAGDKTVNKYYSASDENLTDIAEELIYKISVQDSEKALEQIQTYQKFSGLPSEAVNLFNILTNFIEYFNSTDKQFDTQAIIRALRNTQCSKLKELYQSLHVRVIFNEKGEKQARSLYKSYSDEANYYLMAVYDHLLASSDELDERYNNLHILDDYLLLNLANGLWRFDSFEKAIHVIDHISNNGKNDYIECLRIASKYNSIVKVPNLQSYPYLPRDTARKLKQQIDGFLEIISFKNTLSSFELNLLIAMTNGFLPYLYGLREQAIRFKDEITKKDPDLGQWLEKIYSQTIPDLSKEIIDKLHSGQDLNHHELSDCLTALKHKKLNVQVMEGWLKTSGIIIDTDTTFMQFLKVFILSFKNYKDVKEALDYKKLLNNFIEKNGDSLRTIPAVYLMALIDNLFSIDGRFHISIYNILEKVSKDIAVDNELYFYYLKSLLQLNKLKTLQKEFDKIDESEWTHPLYSLYARYLLEISEYQQAIGTYQKFIDDTNNLYFWHQYLFCCLKNDDIDVAQRELKRIPKRLFSTHTVGFDFFIIQIGNFVDTPFIQKLLVSLFVKNPDDYARIFTQFFLSLIATHRDTQSNQAKDFQGVHQGIIYEINGKRKQALLVDNWLASSKSKVIIDVDRPLGKLLLSMSEGETRELEFEDVKLVEKQEVITTVFQLALHITQETQHNYQQRLFHSFEVTEDSAYEDVVSIMQKINKADNTKDFIEKTDVSLYLKGRRLSGAEVSDIEFEKAYNLLLNQFSNKCVSVSGGNSHVSNAMVIDVYGFIYLCLNNLYKSVTASKISVFITHETDSVIEFWLENVKRKEFLRLAEEDGQLRITNSESVKFELGSFIENIEAFKDYSQILTPNISDLPTLVSHMDDLISNSVASSIKLSVANDTPWLCLDSFIRNVLANQDGFKIVDLTYFVEEHVNRNILTFEEQKHAMTLWAYTGLFLPYSFKDLIDLADNIDDLPLLSKILTDTPLNFPSSEFAEVLLGQILSELSLKISLYKGQLSTILVLQKAIYACLTKSLDALEYRTQEEKIAKIAFHILTTYPLAYVNRITIGMIDNFASGHFMNIKAINDYLKEMAKPSGE